MLLKTGCFPKTASSDEFSGLMMLIFATGMNSQNESHRISIMMALSCQAGPPQATKRPSITLASFLTNLMLGTGGSSETAPRCLRSWQSGVTHVCKCGHETTLGAGKREGGAASQTEGERGRERQADKQADGRRRPLYNNK